MCGFSPQWNFFCIGRWVCDFHFDDITAAAEDERVDFFNREFPPYLTRHVWIFSLMEFRFSWAMYLRIPSSMERFRFWMMHVMNSPPNEIFAVLGDVCVDFLLNGAFSILDDACGEFFPSKLLLYRKTYVRIPSSMERSLYWKMHAMILSPMKFLRYRATHVWIPHIVEFSQYRICLEICRHLL